MVPYQRGRRRGFNGGGTYIEPYSYVDVSFQKILIIMRDQSKTFFEQDSFRIIWPNMKVIFTSKPERANFMHAENFPPINLSYFLLKRLEGLTDWFVSDMHNASLMPACKNWGDSFGADSSTWLRHQPLVIWQDDMEWIRWLVRLFTLDEGSQLNRSILGALVTF